MLVWALEKGWGRDPCISIFCTHLHLSELTLQEAVITQTLHFTLQSIHGNSGGVFWSLQPSAESLRWGHVSHVYPWHLTLMQTAGSGRQSEVSSPSSCDQVVHLLHVTSSLLFLPFSFRCMCVQLYCRLDRQHPFFAKFMDIIKQSRLFVLMFFLLLTAWQPCGQPLWQWPVPRVLGWTVV